MVGHKLLELLGERGGGEWRAVVFAEEPRLAYDRVNLTKYFSGKSAEALSLVEPGAYERQGVTVHLGDRVVAIDRAAKTVTSASGRTVGYDALVLATGSTPFVPPIPGRDAAGCFVYRTIDDLDAIRRYADGVRRAAVIGGGLLGLEAAAALRALGLDVNVVELAPRLMALQLDEVGGALLGRRIAALGVGVHVGKSTTRILVEEGRAVGLAFADGGALDADLVVFSVGIRPRDELARAAGLEIGQRGGILIDDQCRTSDPDIYAVGECALHGGRVYGLVAPGYRMAEVAVDALLGGEATFHEMDLSAKLKLLGVEVASFGDALATQPGARVVSFLDDPHEVYKKLVLSSDGQRLIGGMLVGDAVDYAQLVGMMQRRAPLPARPEELILGARSSTAGGGAGAPLAADAMICSCLNVSRARIVDAVAGGCQTLVALKRATGAGSGCGSCVPVVAKLLDEELAAAGVAVSNHLCAHFPHSRQELYSLVRLHRIKTFDELLAAHGRGAGCEICKPVVASILASAWNEHVLDRRHLPLQDTNDRYLANIQRDGTYSVVPRIPGGEITPDKLIAIGMVAKKYGLYTKITGGQRVDLFGARLEQLPEIWRELIDAGFESGHAYGKALRTVKSCVGSTWCRYGVQDSVSFAVYLENRYKGLRAPHKLKSAVSGCARECAEAQSKDFGLIATERGYNLYVCGNGGMKPQHAALLATDLDEASVIRLLDRFLMFYIRTANRLQRTASWLNELEGGIEYLRRVIVDDELGICAELEAEMAHVVNTYRCEWRATLEDPQALRQFRTFVNSPAADPSIVHVPLRDQHRPATWQELERGK
jgi:nitrite reductase (NADH) large subunit